MKIQTYIDKLKEDGESSGTASSEKTEKKSNQPTILHRSDKQKKVDESLIKTIEKADKDYDRMGGWKMQENERERYGKSSNFTKDFLISICCNL